MKFTMDVSINTGAALILWAMGFFILVGLMAVSPVIASLCVPILTGWTGGLVSILFKKVSDDKHDIEAARDDLGDKLHVIKLQAAGQAGGSCDQSGVYHPLERENGENH